MTGKNLVACFSCLALGAALGALGPGVFGTRAASERALTANAAAGVGSKTALLQLLRSGQSNDAIALVETLLDSDLVVLGLVDATNIGADERRAIERAAAYRLLNPRKSNDPIVDAAVEKVFKAR